MSARRIDALMQRLCEACPALQRPAPAAPSTSLCLGLAHGSAPLDCLVRTHGLVEAVHLMEALRTLGYRCESRSAGDARVNRFFRLAAGT